MRSARHDGAHAFAHAWLKPGRRIWLAALIGALVLLLLPGKVYARGTLDGRVVVGGSFVLKEGEVLDGDLVVFGGTARIEVDSRVRGDVVLIGGSLNVEGEVEGSVVAVGGALFLGEHALVRGDVATLGAVIEQEEGAQVLGEIKRNAPGGEVERYLPEMQVGWGFGSLVLRVLWFLFLVFASATLAVLVALLFPEPTERIGRVVAAQPVLSAGVGLLALIVGFFGFGLLVLTIILIPVSLLGFFALLLIGVFGWVSLGHEVGRRLGEMFQKEWPPGIAAGLGTFLLTFVTYSFNLGGVPCLGWLLPFAVGVTGLGAVVLSLSGERGDAEIEAQIEA